MMGSKDYLMSKEKAVWLAHMMKVMAVQTGWGFEALPDPYDHNGGWVVCAVFQGDLRGYLAPMEEQPWLNKDIRYDRRG
jgi:hypothetical protein